MVLAQDVERYGEPDWPFTVSGDSDDAGAEGPLAVVIVGRFGIPSEERVGVGRVVLSVPTPGQALAQRALELVFRTFPGTEVVERIEEAVA